MSVRGCQRLPSPSSASGTRRGGRARATFPSAPPRVWAALSRSTQPARGPRLGVAALGRPASTVGAQAGRTAAHGGFTVASAPKAHRRALPTLAQAKRPFRRRNAPARRKCLPFKVRAPEAVPVARRHRKWMRPAGGGGGRPALELLRAAGQASLWGLRRRSGLGWPGAASGCPWGARGRAGDAGRPWTPLRSRCLR